MTFELTTGMVLSVDGYRFRVTEQNTYHEIDLRIDMAHIAGATPAHERVLLALQPEAAIFILQRFQHNWMAQPDSAMLHDGEMFTCVYRGAAHSTRKARAGKRESKAEYVFLRSDSGRVIFTIAKDDEMTAYLGVSLPPQAVLHNGKPVGKASV